MSKGRYYIGTLNNPENHGHPDPEIFFHNLKGMIKGVDYCCGQLE